jgi:hypothetical protein
VVGASGLFACVDQRCFEDADCVGPRICGPKGRCILECTPARPCAPGFACVDHHCRADGSEPIVCPDDMVAVASAFCIDRYEASRVDATSASPGSVSDRAVSIAGVLPWQVGSNALAEEACAKAEKRLCTPNEWELACAGPDGTDYAYGDTYEPATCNGIDTFGRSNFHLMPTGSFSSCTNEWGAFDLNGNLWEHTAAGTDMTIRGGAYNCSDSATLHRCTYVPASWRPSARGFRCCRAPLPPEEPSVPTDGSGEGGGCVVEDGGPTDPAGAGGEPRDDAPFGDANAGDAAGNEEAGDPLGDPGPKACPDDMVDTGSCCIDRYEASRLDATATSQGSDGTRAVSQPGVLPWYVNYMTAPVLAVFGNACAAAGKRMCTREEWFATCTGPGSSTYGYASDVWNPAICNSVETYCQHCCDVLGISPCPTGSSCGYSSQLTYGSPYTPETCDVTEPYGPSCKVCFHVMPTGSFDDCTNGFGAFDVNGNVWEIVPSTVDPYGRTYEVRGGAFNCGDPTHRFACTFNAGWAELYAGFRCCKDRDSP